MKTVPLSVRVSDEDAEFIAKLSVFGAITPSDKLRTIIQEARRRHEAPGDYSRCLSTARELIEPVLTRIRELENRENCHSELVMKLSQWLPETVAYFMSSLPSNIKEKGSAAGVLETVERGFVERVFTLIESVLRMAITRQNPCYDRHAISHSKHLETVLELAQVISSMPKSKEK